MHRVDVHMPAWMRDQLDRLADREGSSRNSVIVRLIDQALRSRCLAPTEPGAAVPSASPRVPLAAAPGTSTRPSARRSHPWRSLACSPRVVPGGRR